MGALLPVAFSSKRIDANRRCYLGPEQPVRYSSTFFVFVSVNLETAAGRC